jgi:hypothetical protein
MRGLYAGFELFWQSLIDNDRFRTHDYQFFTNLSTVRCYATKAASVKKAMETQLVGIEPFK